MVCVAQCTVSGYGAGVRNRSSEIRVGLRSAEGHYRVDRVRATVTQVVRRDEYGHSDSAGPDARCVNRSWSPLIVGCRSAGRI
jgi:hypothetical protein